MATGKTGPIPQDRAFKSVILGTAGHIDHGKSSLVKALTGVDPDRLKEEKERGITIDLGFANLSFPEDNLSVGIVDVPGHERLIKNMLAGAGGIDIVLLVIAADEGVMPQSREHLAICELLKIKAGIAVITKADLVDEDWIQLVSEDVRKFVSGTFLANADIIAVSAKTGLNLDILIQKIRTLAAQVSPKLVDGIFRLPIDRVFTLKGFGTVVTGTALSGTISLDSQVEILPSGIKSKVRGLQTHGRAVDKAYAGQRTGLNLQGVDRELLRRGDVVVMPERFVPTLAIDAKLEMLNDAPTVKSRSRVHFYTGTSETVARIIIYGNEEVKAGESCYCQFRLEEPVVTLSGDRYIIRRFSPLETIGGGSILDPHPVRRKKKMGTGDLRLFETGTLQEKIETLAARFGAQGCKVAQIEGWFHVNLPEITSTIDKLISKGLLLKTHGVLFHRQSFHNFASVLKSALAKFHVENPLKGGMPKEELKAKLRSETGAGDDIFELLAKIEDVVLDKEIVRLKKFKVALTTADNNLREKITSMLNKDGFQPPSKPELAKALAVSESEAGDLLKLLSQEGALVRINDSVFVSSEQYDKMISLLRAFYLRKPEMTVAEFRDLLGTTRKFALPFLEYLDSNKITLRIGDIRKFMLK
ncbi:MAG TPA: selenocysteine-specific translation elongation factor [Dissulfurispiraceae bacterium]|nr:selenocysteine-specific translation elongation factor [Dissulfurispiraceae bacterium]